FARLVCSICPCRDVLVDCSHESRMREICTSGSMRGQRALLAGLLYSQKGFTQNSQLKTQNAGYASCKENKILVTTGITGQYRSITPCVGSVMSIVQSPFRKMPPSERTSKISL